MRELDSILGAWRANRQAPGVLATVVHVEGSAYRRPGARMLIYEGGPCIGTISGGCLEGEVVRKASWWTARGEPAVRVYDTMSDEDDIREFGLGCNGIIHLLLERVESPRTAALLTYLDEQMRERRACVTGTVIRCAEGGMFRVGDHLLGADVWQGALSEEARRVQTARRSRLVHLPEADVFLEYLPPRRRLVIFGAGHDALPVVAQASAIGWDVTVADVRSGYAKAGRFPGASRVVLLPPSGDASLVEVDRDTAVVVMTHNLLLDARLLPQLLRARPAYLGILGPKKRFARVAREAGIPAEPASGSLHAPAGLDLGGDGPEAIALSLIAEIQAHLNGRAGTSLRHVSGSIHEPVDESGVRSISAAVLCEQALCEAVHG